ncbi:MAG: 23S rRNA methyltransferase [Chromatiales bacterium]|nr:23S rRNA methyltransferase [Chromatiales bacterium]
MRRSTSSRRWLERQRKDPYVQAARSAGWRSRAVYKLEEIDQRERLLRPGMRVVDLGAAPGGWSQYAAQRVGRGGQVIALDVLEMPPIDGVGFIQGDFRSDEVLANLERALAGRRVDLVLSDLAPNLSGARTIDQPRAMYLAELARDFAVQWLNQGGTLVIKAFVGDGFETLVADLRKRFARVVQRKPAASRDRSREQYVIARDYRGGSESSSPEAAERG